MNKIDMNDAPAIAALAASAGVTLGQVRNAVLMAGPFEKQIREYLQVYVCEKARARTEKDASRIVPSRHSA